MVERGPEKAGVGGSIPSLGIFPSITWQRSSGSSRFIFLILKILQDLNPLGGLVDLVIPAVDIDFLGIGRGVMGMENPRFLFLSSDRRNRIVSHDLLRSQN